MHIASMQKAEQWKRSIFKAARGAERRLTPFGKRAVQLKTAMVEGIEDRLRTANRTMRNGYRGAEDFIDDTTHRMKRDPLRTLGICFAAGVAAGWLLPHRARG
jgi:hypothetical protein